MGIAPSVLESLNNEDLVKTAEKAKISPDLIEAIKKGNLDGKSLVNNANSMGQVISNTTNETLSDAAATNKLGFNIDYNGQTAAWYFRWAIENKIPGYGQWMMKRRWAWYTAWNALKLEAWTFNQVQKGVLACYRQHGFIGDEQVDMVRNWLKDNNETPEKDEKLEEIESSGSVCKRIIFPLTIEDKKTYAQLHLQNSEHSKKATHFLSHSWSYPFWSVLEGLLNHQLGYDRSWMYICSLENLLEALDAVPSPNYYWFDLFNKNQHIVTSDTTAIELAESIKTPGKVVFLLHPIEKWSLKRIWCLYEVLICLQIKAELQVTYSFEMVDVFERQKINDNDVKKKIPWYSMERYRGLSRCDVNEAEASYPEDIKLILDQIESSIGKEEMNRIVKKKLGESFEQSSCGLVGKSLAELKAGNGDLVDNDETDFIVIYDERDL